MTSQPPILSQLNAIPVDKTNDWLHCDPLGWDMLDAAIETKLLLDIGSTTDDSTDISTNHSASLHSRYQDPSPTNQKVPTMQPMSNDKDILKTVSATQKSASIQHLASQQQPIEQIQETSVIKFDGDTSRANPHFRPLLPKPIHRGETGRQLIMDTETTGLDALKGDRIVEVGIIEMVNRKFTGEKLHVYINPERSMDDEVIRIHGISEAFLADKPIFRDVAQPLYDFMLGAEVIAHNAPFDISFLSMEFDKVGLSDFVKQVTVTDSLAMAKQQYPGQRNTLDALVRRLNVGKMDRVFHGALLDSEILAEVYLAMTGGQVSLAIDEDDQTDGNNVHQDFSHLADRLVTDTSDANAHLRWVTKLIAKNANLAQSQGIPCFFKVAYPETVPTLSRYNTKITNVNTVNLTTNLFLAANELNH